MEIAFRRTLVVYFIEMAIFQKKKRNKKPQLFVVSCCSILPVDILCFCYHLKNHQNHISLFGSLRESCQRRSVRDDVNDQLKTNMMHYDDDEEDSRLPRSDVSFS